MKTIKIYWSDLTLSKQKEILELLGDNGNYDVFPLTIIEYEDVAIDTFDMSNSHSNFSDAINKEKALEKNYES